jgi:transposase InsO family protein
MLKDLLEQGIPISRKRVVRLMRAEGLKARVRKRFHSTTMSDHDHRHLTLSALDNAA